MSTDVSLTKLENEGKCNHFNYIIPSGDKNYIITFLKILFSTVHFHFLTDDYISDISGENWFRVFS